MESTPSVPLSVQSTPNPSSFVARLSKPFSNVDFRAESSKFSMSGVGVLDSGSNVNVISASLLPDPARQCITPSREKLTGVGGANSEVGEFVCDITLGEATFRDVHFLVTAQSPIPILIGNPV